jgi:hypothetical protein
MIYNDTGLGMTYGDEQGLVILAMLEVVKRGMLCTNYENIRLTLDDKPPEAFRVSFFSSECSDGLSVRIPDEDLRVWLHDNNVVSGEKQAEMLQTITGCIDDARAACLEAVDAIEAHPWGQFTQGARDGVENAIAELRAAASSCDDAEQELDATGGE